MTDIIHLAEAEIAAGLHWIKTTATAIYGAIQPMVVKALHAFEHTVVQNLWGAAAAFVQKALTAKSLVDLETAFLNTLQHLWPDLMKAAVALGSMLLQSLLGLIHAKAQPVGA